MVLAGCRTLGASSGPADLCDAKASAGWQELSEAPANAKDLMQLPAPQGHTVASWWSAPAPAVEVWFAKDPAHLKACTFKNVANECDSDVTSVEFTRVGDYWKAGTVLSRVCVTADARVR